MIIENVLARIEVLERELSAAVDRLDTLEKRGPITTQAVTPASTPAPAPVAKPTATTTKPTAK